MVELGIGNGNLVSAVLDETRRRGTSSGIILGIDNNHRSLEIASEMLEAKGHL